MNFPFFIVKKIARNKEQSFSRFIIKISVAAVALSMAVMIIATALISGFQQTISNKVFNFWAHIIVTPYEASETLDKVPLSTEIDLYQNPQDYKGVKHIQSVALKGGIIHTNDDFEGIMLKGIAADFKKEAVVNNIVDGQLFEITGKKSNKDILISKITASRLRLNVGDKIIISFLEDNAKVRKRNFNIAGIYDSGIAEFDKQYAWIDMGVIQHLNGWEADEVGGFELFIDDSYLFENKLLVYAKKLIRPFVSDERKVALAQTPFDKIGDELFYSIDNDLYAQTIKEFKPDIFNWLELQNTNEIVILIVMLLVAAVNMITSLLILILERTPMVGILKALGSTEKQLRQIFVWNGIIIMGFGLLIGNIVGISFCYIQDWTHLIKLPQDSYYIDYAPVKIEWAWLLFLNAFTLISGALFLLLPVKLINKITVIKAIRFS